MLLLPDQLREFPNLKDIPRDRPALMSFNINESLVKAAYIKGYFPWYNEGEPVLWWNPDPRFVLFPDELIVSHSMKSLLRKNMFSFEMNQRFEEVMKQCASVPRPGQNGTWINRDMIKTYTQLHREGLALSGECLLDGKLVGGLYGLITGKVFSGESMFSLESNASKFAFIMMVGALKKMGITVIDCQVHTPHLRSLGAGMISRRKFMQYLKD